MFKRVRIREAIGEFVEICGMKFVLVFEPRRRQAASSYARAASSAVSKVPNHIRIFFVVSLISATHLPDGRRRTPTNLLALFPLLLPLDLFDFPPPPWVSGDWNLISMAENFDEERRRILFLFD